MSSHSEDPHDESHGKDLEVAKPSTPKSPEHDWAAFNATTVEILDSVDRAHRARREKEATNVH